ncbi:MAG: hypothetical protein KAU94_03700, partial [Verrucomicrobia bacterium]|nr:hypothetical protein [Verrucomicrobiota bacterium]
VTKEWGESHESDWITRDMIMRLPKSKAEKLLLKHWDHLHFSPNFVQAALYVSTPRLLTIAKTAISECPKSVNLLKHISSHFGIKTKGHPGITREAQIHALSSYLHLLSEIDIWFLWEACNDKGWFTLRRELLDEHMKSFKRKDLWNSCQAVTELDEMISENRIIWIDHWIDRFLKTDVLWSEILTTMTTWLDQRRSFEALQVVASAVVHRGTREDLTALKTYEGMPESETNLLIADTKFAVQRRSIH